MKYRERVRRVLDWATGQPVCALCYADISHRRRTARFCSDKCRNIAKARRQRRGE